ncbi:NAD(P)/FAD-dependent oxidoreductase [Deinococcus rubellus]|uniref:Ferredoxin--NADP reductase n=1 Tax=Deinococcus rubellus TaxID=1889240 RepID=A0ABY5YD89_9DEIO|nr:NAD(P)/FAD-dependent oxidoreductase [Deinococcus rubellus]UWX63004.1 NAD(P)/FAD-dependent oxidoreductase [Deinococcus rubellus]
MTPLQPAAPTDLLIIGAGPAGLHAAFYAGLRGLSVRLIDVQPEVGGQLSALYPDKLVYDLPGSPSASAADIVAALATQLAPFSPDYRLSELAQTLTQTSLSQTERGWTVTSDRASYPARAVIVAAGLGALLPRESRLGGQHPDVRTVLVEPSAFKGKSVLIVGGVPQAVRAALDLAAAGAQVTLTHRRALFRGSPAQLRPLEELKREGQITVHAPAEPERLDEAGMWLRIGNDLRHIAADSVYVANGHLPDLSALQSWPLGWQGEYIPADATQMTRLPGVFVAGDVSLTGGDFKLLSVGLAQAALAANFAAQFVNPALKARPGHSSDRRLPQPADD